MLLSIGIIIVCVLLISVVLIQNSKGGGIQSQFGVANQIMGVKRGADFIEKATWTLAILLLAFSLLMTPKAGSTPETKSLTKDAAANAVMPAVQPTAPPANAPVNPATPPPNN